MRLLKVALASVNTTVGAVHSNVDSCIELARSMGATGAALGVFPEQAIGGYAAEDLVHWGGFVAAQRDGLARFAEETRDLATVLLIGVTIGVGGELFNCGAVVHRGVVLGLSPKEKLPTYDIFYEGRTLSRGAPGLALDAGGWFLGDRLYAFDFGTLAVEVCEDIWSPDGPMRRRCFSGAELVCNLSASPFRAGITGTRREMLATRAADNQCAIAYANLLGGNDGLVFDGGGFLVQNGRVLLDAPRMVEGYATATLDLDRTTRCRREASTWRSDLEVFRRSSPAVPTLRVDAPTLGQSGLAYPGPPPGATFFLPAAARDSRSPREALLDDFFAVIGLAVADYFRKTGAFRCIGVALSGGRDSLLALLIAAEAVRVLSPGLEGAALAARRRELLWAFSMPSRYSSEGTRSAAATIAEELGITLTVLPIEDAFERELEATSAMLGPGGPPPTELTRQNVQARIRGQRMWNWANTSGALFLQTGNMSEKSVGYTTVGGDLEGALSVIANLPKTVVIALLERLEARFGYEGIRRTLATVAGPELADSQAGEAELMPFEVLDACLYLYAGEKLAPHEVGEALASLFPERDPASLAASAEKFARLFTQSIFKWVQSPLAVHVGSLDLDRERALQLPVVQRSEWARR